MMQTLDWTITREDVERVYGVIAPYVRKTPVLHLTGTDFGLGAFPLTLKLESLQVAGAFKARGAFANLLLRKIPRAGVTAASGGNHGVAVAYAARALGYRARIFVPHVASPAKIARIRAYGAELCIIGDRYADALEANEAWAAESGALSVHAFDQRETLLGQATVALELSARAPDIDTLLVPVGGGGLIGGIASWYAGSVRVTGSVRVVGVEPVEAPTLTAALRAGAPVDAPAGGVAADSLAPRRIGNLVFPIARAHVEQVLLVTDADIREAQRALWEAARLVAEPGGAAALAALTSRVYKPHLGESVGLIISGGNS
jgi:threonine dehydratase